MRHIPQITWQYDESRIIHTTAYEATQDWLDEATNTPGIWALLGEPGVGKTFGAIAYALKHHIPFLTPPPDTDITVRKWFRYLAIHLLPEHNPNDDPYYALCDWCETNALSRLILDEAVRLNRKCLDALRDLHDRYPVSIVLIGTSQLERKLSHYDTLVHRVCGVWRIPPFSPKDIETMFDGIDKRAAIAIYNRTGGNYRHLARLAERLQQMPTSAITPGVVHSLADRYILTKPQLNNKEDGR